MDAVTGVTRCHCHCARRRLSCASLPGPFAARAAALLRCSTDAAIALVQVLTHSLVHMCVLLRSSHLQTHQPHPPHSPAHSLTRRTAPRIHTAPPLALAFAPASVARSALVSQWASMDRSSWDRQDRVNPRIAMQWQNTASRSAGERTQHRRAVALLRLITAAERCVHQGAAPAASILLFGSHPLVCHPAL